MKRNSYRILVSVTALIASLVFGASLILQAVFVLISASLFLKILIMLIASIFVSTMIVAVFLTFNPTLREEVIGKRSMARFESFSHPLLLRLAYEAPGTFHHSINVSILAQKAAKAIGADTLLVRVAAYYHDIGKLKEPKLFIENQSVREIPTVENADYIRGNAKRIIEHIEYGAMLGKQYHLPKEILDIIYEHHGTTKVLYFFEKAKEKGLKIKKTDFSYSGPKPLSKEAAILMFSDSSEAAIRASSNPSPDKICEVVLHTIEDKKREHQLQKSGLSETELQKISHALVEALTSIYHQRIM